MLKRLFVLAILLVFAGGVAHAQSVPSCTLTGTVQDASGQPLKNGVINFDSIKTQVLAGGQTVARKIISINTDQNGVIGPNTFAQLLVNSITICDQLGNCGAPFSAIIPNQSTAPFGNMVMGTYLIAPIPNPAASGQVFGVNSNNTPEWQTVSGGRGNCSFVWNSANSYTLNCPGFATLASPTFTGTVAVASGGTIQTPTLTLTGTGPATQQFFGSATTPIGSLSSGATAPNMNMAAGAYNNGTSWTASATTADLITEGSTGISFFENTGLTVGNSFTPTSIGTWSASGLTLPTGSVLSVPTVALANPLAITSGGTGNATPPTSPQILIAQSATGYAPETVGGDMVLAANGTATVTKTNGVALGPLATASAPLSPANGGTGTSSIPTTPQMLVAQSSGVYAPETIGGDINISTSGSVSVLGLHFTNTNPAVVLGNTPPASGGILYFSSTTTLSSSGLLAANVPVLGGGAGGAPTTGTRSGSTTVFGTTSGTLGSGHCVQFDASGNLVDAGGACATTGGPSFPAGGPPQLAGFGSTNVSEAETVGGDLTFARAGAGSYTATVTKTNGVLFTGLATAAIPLSVAMGGTGSTTLSFAPLVNPTNGQNNYASSSSATLSSPTFTGTMTFPDGSTYTSVGHNTMKALGIGTAASVNNGILLANTASSSIYWGSATTPSAALGSLAAAGNLNLSAGAHANGTSWIADTANSYIWSVTNTGLSAFGNVGATVGASFSPTQIAILTTAGLTLPIKGGVTGGGESLALGIPIPSDDTGNAVYAPAGLFSPSATGSAYSVWDAGLITSTGTGSGNCYKVSSQDGTGFHIVQNGSTHEFGFFMYAGQTTGTCLTGSTPASQYMALRDTANTGSGPGLWVNSGSINAVAGNFSQQYSNNSQSGIFLNNPSTGTTAQTMVRLTNDANVVSYLILEGNGFSSGDPVQKASTLELYGGQDVALVANGGSYQIRMYESSSLVGRFTNLNAQNAGLFLPGYASPFGENYTRAALSIGDSYQGAFNWAALNISGGVYYNGSTGQWITDGGAGSGSTMLALGPGGCIYMYNYPAAPINTVVTWVQIGGWCGSGMATDHLSNLETSGIPVVSSGTLLKGSRDMFGWIMNVKGGQTTIQFSEHFEGESNCTLTSVGAPDMWFNSDQTATGDTFVCVVPHTGLPCADGAMVEYHCFGQGDENTQVAHAAAGVNGIKNLRYSGPYSGPKP
jgi:hypothetical protein